MDEAVALLEGAGVGQAGWEAALDSVARVTGSMGAQLIGLGRDALIPFNLMTGVPPEAVADFEAAGGGDPRVNSRVRVGSRSDELVVLDEAAFTTEADMRRHPDYANWIHTYDMHHTCLTTLVKGPDSLVGLALLRGRRHGHIDDEAKRAFARLAGRARSAVRTQIALQDQSMLLAAGMMEAMGATVFICDDHGRVRAMTPSAEALLAAGDFLRLRSGTLTAAREADQAGLGALIAAAAGKLETPRSLTAVRQSTGDDVLLLEAAPLPPGHGPRLGARVLVIALAPTSDEARLAEAARALYGLSAAESAVAAQLALGRNPAVIAHGRSVSIGTVRSQVRRILEKAGAASQLEFAALLARY